MEPFLLQPPIWDLVKRACPSGELDEVKEAIGPSLVELASDLFQEASTMLEIYQATHEEFDSKVLELDTSSQLPEPPAVRERLLQEISFLIEHIQQRSHHTSPQSVVTASSQQRPSVVDYVIKASASSRSSTASSGRRPVSSACGHDGRITPLHVTPTSESESGSSSLSDKIDAVSNSINSMDIDIIVQHIRDALSEECLMRKRDIQFLQTCLEEEVKHNQEELTSLARSKPSLQELKDLRSSLEGEIHSTVSVDTETNLQAQTSAQFHPSKKVLDPLKKAGIPKRPSTAAAKFREMVQKTRSGNQDFPSGKP